MRSCVLALLATCAVSSHPLHAQTAAPAVAVAPAKLPFIKAEADAAVGALAAKLEENFVLPEVGKRWSDAKVRPSPRHWFEVSHISYLKGIERLLKEVAA